MIEMNPKLYAWLQKKFYYDNHNKYKKYFYEWVSNIIQNQIDGFEHQMEVEESGVLNCQTIKKKMSENNDN